MNIRNQFNRLAKGLTLSLSIALSTGIQAADVGLIPAGQNPSFLNNVYEKFREKDNIRNPAGHSIHTSVTALANIPDSHWLRQLKNMPAAQAEKEVRLCLETLCAEKYKQLDPEERVIANIMVLEAMFHNSLNTLQEFRAYSEFMANFEPDARFKQHDDEIIASVVNAVLGSAIYQNINENLLPIPLITTRRIEEQYHLRVDFIQFLATQLRHAFGRGPIPVYLDTFPDHLSNIRAITLPASYVLNAPQEQFILINYSNQSVNSPKDIINYVVHEVRHSIDFMAADELRNREFGTEDFQFGHTAAIILNGNSYFKSCIGNIPPGTDCNKRYKWHRDQYIERSAHEFAERFIEKMDQEIEKREATPAPAKNSRRLEPQKFKLPS